MLLSQRIADVAVLQFQTMKEKCSTSITCTPDQKQRFREAADKSGMRFPDFMNRAVEEYIDRHHLE